MPTETTQAVQWALTQQYTDLSGEVYPVTKNDVQAMTDTVRQYFGTNKIAYTTFDFSDLQPYL